MSEESSRGDDDAGDGLAISDDQLPEDLRPTDENPLAQPTADDVPDDILKETSGTADSGGASGDASHTGEGDASDTSSFGGASSETEGGRAPAEGLEDSSDA